MHPFMLIIYFMCNAYCCTHGLITKEFHPYRPSPLSLPSCLWLLPHQTMPQHMVTMLLYMLQWSMPQSCMQLTIPSQPMDTRSQSSTALSKMSLRLLMFALQHSRLLAQPSIWPSRRLLMLSSVMM